METIKGAFVRFLAPPGKGAGDSALAVVRYESSGQMVEAKVSGPFSPMVQQGEWVVMEGDWRENVFRGRAEMLFRARSVFPDLPSTKAGAYHLFTQTFSPDMHGVGTDAVRAFVEKHGDRAALKAESDPDILLALTSDRARFGKAIQKAWSRRISARQPIRAMKEAGVSDAAVKAVIRHCRDAAMATIERNPYSLAPVPGVGFQQADLIGRHRGIAADDPARIAAAVADAVGSQDTDGHTYVPFSDMKPALDRNGVDAAAFRRLIAEGGDGSLVFDREDGMPVAQRRYLHDCERLVAVSVARLLERGRSEDTSSIDRVTEEVLAQEKYSRFDEVQRAAVETSARETVSILTGGPGTGKSTVTEAIAEIAALTAKGPVILMAPTGKAARRLEETTKRPASTVHRALEATGQAGGARFARDRNNPLPAGCFVIVDEASMLDTEMAAALLDALPPDGRLLLVGDRNQLPSVGPGYVLGDLINARAPNGNRVPCSELLTVYRSKKNSMIAHGAAEIRDGSFDTSRLDNVMRGGVMMYDLRGSQITERVVHLMSRVIPKSLKLDPMKDVAVLCPQRPGTAGTWELNAALSRALNPKGRSIPGLAPAAEDGHRTPLPRVGDRVMMTRNDYENDVMNGDVGTITGAYLDESGARKEMKVEVEFDAGQKVAFPLARCRDLILAYAITGHKSQGSQYPCVIMPVSRDHSKMLDRTLVYTEWTRAQDFLILVGEEEVLSSAIGRVTAQGRRTRLKSFLARTLDQIPPAVPVPTAAPAASARAGGIFAQRRLPIQAAARPSTPPPRVAGFKLSPAADDAAAHEEDETHGTGFLPSR